MSVAPQPDPRVVHLTSASTIAVRPVRWHWAERLALGALALLAGREGIGKTTVWTQAAADTTHGRLPGANHGTPRSVIVAASEDSWEHTIVPRLLAAGADLTRIYRVDVLTPEGTNASLTLPIDLPELKRVIRVVDAALVILDPLLSRLDVRLDSHKDSEVRQALEPLVSLADAANVCVLGLIHVNKTATTDPLTSIMGSRAFAAVARTVLFVMADPDDESRRLLGTPKNNLGRVDLPTLAFRIVGVKVADTAEGEVWTSQLEWLGESERSIRDAIESTADAAVNRTATSEAADWLEDYLSSQTEPVDSAVVKREGRKADHSKDALHRACQRIGVVVESLGFPRKTYWHLPASHRNAGRVPITATTATTATTGQGRHIDLSLSDYQSSQSSQWSQSSTAPAHARRLGCHCNELPEGGPCSYCDGPDREVAIAH